MKLSRWLLYGIRTAICAALVGEMVLFWWLNPTSWLGLSGCAIAWVLTYAAIDETVRFWWYE